MYGHQSGAKAQNGEQQRVESQRRTAAHTEIEQNAAKKAKTHGRGFALKHSDGNGHRQQQNGARAKNRRDQPRRFIQQVDHNDFYSIGKVAQQLFLVRHLAAPEPEAVPLEVVPLLEDVLPPDGVPEGSGSELSASPLPRKLVMMNTSRTVFGSTNGLMTAM